MDNRENQTTRDFAWLPTLDQEFLLKAALLNNSSAVSCWQNWTARVAPANANFAEKRFYPLVYHNLQNLRYADEHTEILRTAHRESFKKVTLILKLAGELIDIFKANGIRTLLLKGIPLAVQYYPSPALRPMADIDLMVEPKNVLSTAAILNDRQWRMNENNLPRIMEIIHSCQFLDAENRELDLHWRLLRDCWNADKNDIFWKAAVPLEYQTIKGETLCATDHLFHVCCHGARFNNLPPIRWVADALMILNSPAEIDWRRLLRCGEIYRLNLPLLYALRYLKEKFAAPVPSDFLESLEKTPKSWLEVISFRNLSAAPRKWTLGRFCQEIAFQYSSLTSSTNLNPRTLVFIKYLQHFLTTEKIIKKLSPPAP